MTRHFSFLLSALLSLALVGCPRTNTASKDDGEPAEATEPADGAASTDGEDEPADGEDDPADGNQPADGEPADGQQTDGEDADGTEDDPSGEPADGEGNSGSEDQPPARKLESIKLAGHEGSVRSLAFSADGKYLATGCGEAATVKIWEVATTEGLRQLRGH